MTKTLKTIRRIFNLVKSFIPTRVPIGTAEFESFAKDIIELSGAPDNDSTRWALGFMVIHGASDQAYKPKRYFVKCLIKTMSNQICSQVVNDLKAKQEAERAAEAAKAAETADEQAKS